jgi:hypothetical protein
LTASEIETAAEKQWEEEEAAEKEESSRMRYWEREDLGERRGFSRSYETQMIRKEDTGDIGEMITTIGRQMPGDGMMIVRSRHLMKNGTRATSILDALRAPRTRRTDRVTGVILFLGERWVRVEVSVEAMTIQMLRIEDREYIEQVATEGHQMLYTWFQSNSTEL